MIASSIHNEHLLCSFVLFLNTFIKMFKPLNFNLIIRITKITDNKAHIVL